jgi:hypothetical protein
LVASAGVAVGVLWFLGGRVLPAWRTAGALTTALLPFWARAATSPVAERAQNGWRVGLRWAIAVVALVLMAVHGPEWWALP